MFLSLFINNYLKNMSIEKAILVSKQFCIDFTYEEMKIILPIIKNNWQRFLNEQEKMYLMNVISNKCSQISANKTEALLNKLLIIFS